MELLSVYSSTSPMKMFFLSAWLLDNWKPCLAIRGMWIYLGSCLGWNLSEGIHQVVCRINISNVVHLGQFNWAWCFKKRIMEPIKSKAVCRGHCCWFSKINICWNPITKLYLLALGKLVTCYYCQTLSSILAVRHLDYSKEEEEHISS